MPVFHIEEKIALRTWDDILNRSGYQSPVEARNFRFLRIAAVTVILHFKTTFHTAIPAFLQST